MTIAWGVGLEDWLVEAEVEPTLLVRPDGTLDVVAPKGLTLWYRQPVPAETRIGWTVMAVDEGGPFDRVSDLNCFWVASDPTSGDVFTRSIWRGGVFGRYYSLAMYYVGFGGNGNTTTRLRRYDGDYAAFEERGTTPPIVGEYTDPAHLIIPNRWNEVEISAAEGRVQYRFNGELLFDWTDPQPLEGGHFGLRTTQSHLRFGAVTLSSSAAPGAGL